MPWVASAYRASSSARDTRPRIEAGHTATIRTPSAVVCKATCTRTRVPSIVNVARAGRAIGLRNVRSMCRASAERSARRSGAAATGDFDAGTRGFGCRSRSADRVWSCGSATRAARSQLGMEVWGCADEGCTHFPCARCSAEYHACDSARRSIAASGAVRMLKPSCSVIMPASSAHAVNGASPIRYRIIIPAYYCGMRRSCPSSKPKAFCR
jgi:hypothetical protein